MSCNSLTVGASAWLQGFQAAPRYNLASFRVLRLPNHWLVSELQRPVHKPVAVYKHCCMLTSYNTIKQRIEVWFPQALASVQGIEEYLIG